MSFLDLADIEPWERRPGWRGRTFDSQSMTFAHWDFDAGATIPEHFHEQEEVWHVIEGELDVTVDGETRRAGPGAIAIVPPNGRHAVVAVTAGRAMVVDYPLREQPDRNSAAAP